MTRQPQPARTTSRALAIYREHEDRPGEATVLNNMSELYNQSGDYMVDIETLHRVEEINRRHDDAPGLAIACCNLAEAHASIGRHRMAWAYKALHGPSGRIETRLGLAYGRLGLGRLEMDQGRCGTAADYLREAAELFCQLGSAVLETEARLATARALIRKAKGRPDGGRGPAAGAGRRRDAARPQRNPSLPAGTAAAGGLPGRRGRCPAAESPRRTEF